MSKTVHPGASRLAKIPPYLFAEIDRKVQEKKRAGVDVISLGIGDPDLPTPKRIVRYGSLPRTMSWQAVRSS